MANGKITQVIGTVVDVEFPSDEMPNIFNALETEIDGTKLERYIDWLMICGMITLTGCAAASIPCGFTKTNKPVGLQVVARPRGEAEVISACTIFEQAHPYADMVPIKPKFPTS